MQGFSNFFVWRPFRKKFKIMRPNIFWGGIQGALLPPSFSNDMCFWPLSKMFWLVVCMSKLFWVKIERYFAFQFWQYWSRQFSKCQNLGRELQRILWVPHTDLFSLPLIYLCSKGRLTLLCLRHNVCITYIGTKNRWMFS